MVMNRISSSVATIHTTAVYQGGLLLWLRLLLISFVDDWSNGVCT
jgi:hypothetical protein